MEETNELKGERVYKKIPILIYMAEDFDGDECCCGVVESCSQRYVIKTVLKGKSYRSVGDDNEYSAVESIKQEIISDILDGEFDLDESRLDLEVIEKVVDTNDKVEIKYLEIVIFVPEKDE